MCWKTEAGLVQSVGEIRLDAPYDLPEFLQNSRYAIFKEEDVLGLIYHSICIDLVLESRGTTPAEACKRLKNSMSSFIDATLNCFTDKSKAYDALREQKENRDETRELVYRSYNEVLAHNETIIYSKLRPHYKRLHDSTYSKLQKAILAHEFTHLLSIAYKGKEHTNYFAVAYNEEEIERLYKPQKLSDDEIKKIVAFNYYLLSYNMRQNQKVMA
jgi:hypothetical protein